MSEPSPALSLEALAELHPDLLPLAFLIGRWRGEGVGGYPTIEDFGYGQEVSFTAHAGVLAYTSRSWSIDDGRPFAAESGWWRPRPGGDTTPPGTGSGDTTPPGTGSGDTTPPGTGSGDTTPPGTGSGDTAPPGTGSGEVEVLLAHPMGIVEVWHGTVTGPRIEIATDVVARSASATEVTAGHRLYGLVEGDLMYAYDMAAVGQPLQPHLSARLQRVVAQD